MYSILELKSNIRVPPNLLGGDIKESVKSSINKEFVGFIGKEGLFLALVDVYDIGEGVIIPGDGAVYYKTTFKMLVYKPVLHEIVDGEISEVTEFGAFVRIGPIDGLVHISQIMDDYVTYSNTGVISGKETKRTLKAKDVVRGRIIAVSLKSLRGAKIGLTLRQVGLGKYEWFEENPKGSEKKEQTKESSQKNKVAKK